MTSFHKLILAFLTAFTFALPANISAEETKYYSGGAKYVGELQNGKRHGKGTYYYSNGNRFEGEWKNGERDGFGILYYALGDLYEGGYKKGKKQGFGILYLKEGNRIMGEFVKDSAQGYATYYWAEYDDWYIGMYGNDVPQNGTWFKQDGKISMIAKDGNNINSRDARYQERQSPFTTGPTPEGRKHMTRGRFAMEDAKDISGYWKAVVEFIKAVEWAPQWGDAWYNLAVALEKVKDYRGAMVSYRRYLRNTPGKIPDASEIEQRIVGMEYRAEQIEQENKRRVEEARSR